MSDRSCHHAALTGCTPHFVIPKYKHAHSPSPGEEEAARFGSNQSAKYKNAPAEENKYVSKHHKRLELCGDIMTYVARQNLISTAHVDLNCGKTVSRAPQTGSPHPPTPPPPLAISPRGLLTVRCHREQTQIAKRHRRLTPSVERTPLDVARREGTRMYSESIFQQKLIYRFRM